MKFFSCVVLAALMFSQIGFAKEQGKKAGDAKCTPFEITSGGFSNPQSDDLKLLPELTSLHVSKNEGAEQEKLEKLKAEKLKQKIEYLTKNGLMAPMVKNAKTNEPILVSGFNTIVNDGCPSDNSAAVNQNNQLIVVTNSHIKYYNTSGGALQSSMKLETFFSSILVASDAVCDPKVIYDNQTDRFIVYAQSCNNNPTPSKMCVAFSQTNDPTQGWYLYKFSGSPSVVNGGNCWVDYPKLAVSDHDLFITSNMFDASGNSLESVIYQIDKTIGFAGGTFGSANSLIWHNISGSPFTLVPVSNGISGGYGNGNGNKMYLISTDDWNNRLNLYTISDAVGNSPTIAFNTVSIPSFSAASDAIQKGTSVMLMTGDDRGMDGYYLNGTIHFVFHCDGGNGFSCINYSRITNNGSGWVAQNQKIKISNTDCAYPAIASAGYNANDQSSIICYNYCSTNDYPSTAAMFIDNNFVLSSPVIIKAGTAKVDAYAQAVQGGQGNRWGDYSSASRDFSSNPPTIYCYNTYGSSSASSDWVNYMSKLQTVQAAPNGIESAIGIQSTVSVFPNPVIDQCNIKFTAATTEKITINLFGVDGKFVKEIYQSNCHQGENLFSFNKGALDAGVYFLQISSANQILKNEKIIVAQN